MKLKVVYFSEAVRVSTSYRSRRNMAQADANTTLTLVDSISTADGGAPFHGVMIQDARAGSTIYVPMERIVDFDVLPAPAAAPVPAPAKSDKRSA